MASFAFTLRSPYACQTGAVELAAARLRQSSRLIGLADSSRWSRTASGSTIQSMNSVRTPCIGVCSTTSLGDKICRGCKRFNFEVIHWNSYTDEQKLAVLRRIEQFTGQIMQNRFRITDVRRLQEVMDDFRLFYDPQLSPYCWLHALLQKRLHRLQSLGEAGVALLPPHQGRDVRDVLLEINEDLLALGEAHLERYFRHL